MPCAEAGAVLPISTIATTIKTRQDATSQVRIAGAVAVGCRSVCFREGREPAIQNFNADLNAYLLDCSTVSSRIRRCCSHLASDELWRVLLLTRKFPALMSPKSQKRPNYCRQLHHGPSVT